MVITESFQVHQVRGAKAATSEQCVHYWEETLSKCCLTRSLASWRNQMTHLGITPSPRCSQVSHLWQIWAFAGVSQSDQLSTWTNFCVNTPAARWKKLLKLCALTSLWPWSWTQDFKKSVGYPCRAHNQSVGRTHQDKNHTWRSLHWSSKLVTLEHAKMIQPHASVDEALSDTI